MTVRYAKSTAEILRKIGCEYLALYRGEGYWYFVYDNASKPGNTTLTAQYDSESVYVMRLNDMALERWIETGKAFVARMVA